MIDSGFHAYFCRLLVFRWTLYKADISIKQTFVMQQWCPLYRDCIAASKKTSWVHRKILVLVINSFSLNFTSREIDRKRGRSRVLAKTNVLWRGARGGGLKTSKGKQGGRRGGQNLGILGERTFWRPLSVINLGIVSNFHISIDISIDPVYSQSLAKDL